jgi:hypothetical protein
MICIDRGNGQRFVIQLRRENIVLFSWLRKAAVLFATPFSAATSFLHSGRFSRK